MLRYRPLQQSYTNTIALHWISQSKTDTMEPHCAEGAVNFQSVSKIDRLGFNGTLTTNRLHRAFGKYVAVNKVKLLRKLTMLRVGNTYNKPFNTKDITRVSRPSQPLG